jgi:outer membrane protein insertion porin family
MKKILLLILLSLSFFTAAWAQKDTSHGLSGFSVDYTKPHQYTIAKLSVSGDTYLDKSIIIALGGLSQNQKITIPGDEINKAITSLWKQQLFSNVQIMVDSIQGENIYLRYNIKTRPRLNHWEFRGARKGNEKKLKDEVKLSTHDIVTEQLKSSAKQRIKAFYTGKGYPGATVEVEEQATDPTFKSNTVNLIFKISEGKRTRINRIIITGNTAFTEQKLHTKMKKTKEFVWWNVFAPTKFEPDEYETDKGALMGFYHASGYKDARIISDTTYMVADNLMNIEIRINEGHKYYFNKITWSGNTKYASQDLNKILNIKKGDVYNPELLEKGLFINAGGLDVTSLYMDDGYLFFSVTPVETSVDHDSVNMEVRIFEGPQATINKVTVVGNTKTHDHVILRELRTKPGMKFSRTDIIRSQRDLSQLGYFDPEKMNVTPKPNPKDGTVDLEYTVAEKPSDQIELSGGYGAGTLVGVLGLSLNNFSVKNLFKNNWQGYPSGDGQRISVRAQANGPQLQSYNISFTDPWFGGKKPNSLTVSAFYSVQNYTGGQQLQSPGVSVGLGKRLEWPDNYFTLYHSVAYQYYAFKNYPLTNGFNTGYANNFSIKHILSRNSVDHPIYPTQGSIITLSLQWTPPYSLFTNKDYTDVSNQDKFKLLEFHKWKIAGQHYLPLDRQHKLVLQGLYEFGFIGLYNKEIGLTPFERYYVGGDGLTGFYLDGREIIRLRGYANASAVTPTIKDLSGNVIDQGATIYNKFTMELRYPITKSDAATIYALVFAEGGNASLKFADYNPFTLQRSAGGGVRVFLPMFGLLGFDWGYGFDKDLSTGNISGGHFHFYIGQPLF